jgi:hypothetical protein
LGGGPDSDVLAPVLRADPAEIITPHNEAIMLKDCRSHLQSRFLDVF